MELLLRSTNANVVMFLTFLACTILLHHRYLMVSAAPKRSKNTKKQRTIIPIPTDDPTAEPTPFPTTFIVPTPIPTDADPPVPPDEDPFDDETSFYDLSDAAKAAYQFFYPLLVVNYTGIAAIKSLPDSIRNITPGGDPVPFFNTIDNNPNTVNANFTAVRNSNADTLYSQCWIDISEEAMVLTLPEVTDSSGRFFVAQLQDMWSNTFAGPGTRTMVPGGTCNDFPDGVCPYVGKTDFVLCLEDSYSEQCGDLDLPDTAMIINVTTSYIWMIARTQVFASDLLPDEDKKDLYAFQQQYGITPVSNWTAGDGPLPVLNVGSISDPDAPSPNDIVESWSGCDFFKNASVMWGYNRNTEITANMTKILELLRIYPGKPNLVACISEKPGTGNPRALAYETPIGEAWQQKLGALGVENLCSAGAGTDTTVCKKRAGYSFDGLETIGAYGTDYATRALVASVGLGGNLNADATYYLTPPPGTNMYTGKNVISFPASAVPVPAKAFWSVTVYNNETFLVAAPPDYPNPTLGVCVINNQNVNITADANGIINIYLQREMPEGYPAPGINWLCTPEVTPDYPDGEFQMTFRAYWPDESIINFTYPMATIYPAEFQLPCVP